MHLYHYCTTRNAASGFEVRSGTYMMDRPIKTNDDYGEFLKKLADDLGMEKGSFVVSSLTHIYDPDA